MTISTWLLILTLAVGSGTNYSIESNASPCPIGVNKCKIGNNCWINGTWYNPCPEGSDPPPQPENEPPPY